MRKYIMIPGIALIVTILISGSAVAVWHFGSSVADSKHCLYPLKILGDPDDKCAVLGEYPDQDGWIIVDLGSNNKMNPDQQFWVFTPGGGITETYVVSVSETYPGDVLRQVMAMIVVTKTFILHQSLESSTVTSIFNVQEVLLVKGILSTAQK